MQKTCYGLSLQALSTQKFPFSDSRYSLRPWMMTPIIGAIKGSPEAEYNTKQMRCRALIEQCNGVLKMRFRCLLKYRVLHYSPPIASKIIYTCAVLHNMYPLPKMCH
ncbi:putative nuclease HARBI1 [Monomorium pharaonis]|uniref:putative nuclease HARBI1 n=1 Tax=Monomorium pharaonis TaxID=307658 RepID=UPI001747A272|nr:putative nuclease HARBI1 [Monomorium pharaonis]